MKSILLFALFIAVLFISCQHNSQAVKLTDQADLLLDSDPDSAFVLLNCIERPDEMNDKQFARWCMVYSRAAYQINREMPYALQLERALLWYKHQKKTEQQVWTGFYLGRAYTEEKLFVQAKQAYSDALKLAKTHQLYHVAGHICSYMAGLETDSTCTAVKRETYEDAARYFRQAGNMRNYALVLSELSKLRAASGSLPEAICLQLEADSVISDIDDPAAKASIISNLGHLYLKQGNREQAKACYLTKIKYDSGYVASAYLSMGYLFYEARQTDSARYYVQRVVVPDSQPALLADQLYLSYLIACCDDKPAEAMHYITQYQEITEQIHQDHLREDMLNAEDIHNFMISLQQSNQARNRNISLVLFALLLLFLLSLLHQQKNRSKMRQFNNRMCALRQKELQLAEMELVLAETGPRENERECHIQHEMDLLKQELMAMRTEKFETSTVVKKIKKQSLKVESNTKNKLSCETKKQLVLLIYSVYPHIGEFMTQNPFQLSETEQETCFLSFLQLGLNEEAVLLNINPDSVSKRRHRARQKLGLINSNTELNEFLLSGC